MLWPPASALLTLSNTQVACQFLWHDAAQVVVRDGCLCLPGYDTDSTYLPIAGNHLNIAVIKPNALVDLMPLIIKLMVFGKLII